MCRRLRAVVGDPTGPHWSSITWKSSNRVRDTDGLKNALRLSKETLKQLSIFCRGHYFHLSKFVQQLTICTNLQSITLDGVSYTELQIGKVLELSELRYFYLDTSQLCRYQNKIIRLVVAKCSKHVHVETLCIKTLSRYAEKCIPLWARVGFSPPGLRFVTIGDYDHRSFSYYLSQSISKTPATSVSHMSVYKFVRGEQLLHIQYQISPSGVTLLSCPEMQLSVASVKPGTNGMISAKYFDATLEGSIKFANICCKVCELDLNGHRSLTPVDLQQTFAACPNLLRLNLCRCEGVLSDLDGLHAIATNCLKLQVLNLSGSHQVESVERLWRIFASMSNLKVLSLSLELLPQQGLIIPGPLPQLTAISVYGECSETQSSDDLLVFLSRMTSLKVLSLGQWGEIHQLHPLLQQLTHLYLASCKKLFLPAANTLRELFVADWSYEVGRDLIDALAQCRNLEVLVLRVRNFETTVDIYSIATSITTLKLFHVSSWNFEGKRMFDLEVQKRARAFAKSVSSTLKKGGRVVDLKICCIGNACKSLQFPV